MSLVSKADEIQVEDAGAKLVLITAGSFHFLIAGLILRRRIFRLRAYEIGSGLEDCAST